jgi:hypothetical protein
MPTLSSVNVGEKLKKALNAVNIFKSIEIEQNGHDIENLKKDCKNIRSER